MRMCYNRVTTKGKPREGRKRYAMKTYTRITATIKTGCKPQLDVAPISALTAWRAGVRHAKNGDVVTVGHLDTDKHTTIHTVIAVGLETAREIIRNAQ